VGKEQIRDRIDDFPVDLFGVGMVLVESSQPGFDVTDPDATIKSSQRRRHRRGRVALHQEQIEGSSRRIRPTSCSTPTVMCSSVWFSASG
jgi:hypothetical protein